jgi:WD40 repeat protein
VGVEVRGVCLRGNFLVSGDADNIARLWQLGAGDVSRVWKGFRDSEDGSYAEVTLPTCTSKVVHQGSVYCVGVTAGGTVASIGWNKSDLKLWSAAGTAHAITTPAPVMFAMSLTSKLLFLGLRGGHVVSYSLVGGGLVHNFASNTAKKDVTALSVYGTLLVTGCEHAPQGLRVWSLSNEKPELVTNHDARHAIAAVALCPMSGRIIATGTDEELEVWGPREAAVDDSRR